MIGKLPNLNIDYVKSADFTTTNIFFIFQVFFVNMMMKTKIYTFDLDFL